MVEIVEQRGSVADLHALDPFADGSPNAPVVWWCRPDDDALALGSRQSFELVDTRACEQADLSVVRRRSGGGAVLVRRADMVWVDVVLPVGVAPDDVRGSMVWIGEHWRDVMQPLAHSPLTVHRGGMVDTDWSALVCFAGVGPGEVLVDDAKLVGLSQRRTRHGSRVQAMIHRSPTMREYRSLLCEPLPDGEPDAAAWIADLDGRLIAEHLATSIASRITPM